MTCFPASVAVILAAVALSGCAGDANVVRDIAVASGVTGGEPRPPPDFVSRTRGPLEYMPIGVAAPRRALPPKNAAAVGGAEAEMDGLRRRNEARAADARRAAGQAKTP